MGHVLAACKTLAKTGSRNKNAKKRWVTSRLGSFRRPAGQFEHLANAFLNNAIEIQTPAVPKPPQTRAAKLLRRGRQPLKKMSSLSAAAFAAVRRALDGDVDDAAAAEHAAAAPEDRALLALAPGDEQLGRACYHAVRRKYGRDVQAARRLRRRRRPAASSSSDILSLVKRGAAMRGG